MNDENPPLMSPQAQRAALELGAAEHDFNAALTVFNAAIMRSFIPGNNRALSEAEASCHDKLQAVLDARVSLNEIQMRENGFK